MQPKSSKDIINIAVIGTSSSGKTSLVESIAYNVGLTTRLGTVQDGNTISDYLPEEIEKQISIGLSVVSFQYKDKKINIIDTPGFPDFIGEVHSALSVVENCILVLSGDATVDAQSANLVEMVLQQYKLPLSIFVNKLDKENINFEEKLIEIEKNLELNVTPVIIPSEAGSNLSIINLLTQPQQGGLYDKFIENIVSNDEGLMEKYLNNEKIDLSQLSSVMKNAYKSLQLKFLFSGSALKNVAVKELMEFMTNYFVSAENSEKVFGVNNPTAGLVFKTTSEPGMGQMNYIKVYSGKFTNGLDIKNLTKNTTERIGQMAFLQGKKRIETQEIIAGDIGVLIKLKEARTNDILAADNSFAEKIKKIDFPEPLTEMAIISKSKGEEEKVGNAFSNVILEEPTIRFKYNNETKQMVVSGIG
ncbi:MAG: GTP-binding protein, partial [Endomicrobiia bacterium]